MIEKILEYSQDKIKFVLLRDGRFTILHARNIDDLAKNIRFQVGTAWCSKEDKFNIVKGAHIAMDRLVDNLQLPVTVRSRFHSELQNQLGKQDDSNFLYDVMRYTIDEMFRNFPKKGK